MSIYIYIYMSTFNRHKVSLTLRLETDNIQNKVVTTRQAKAMQLGHRKLRFVMPLDY